MRIIKSEHVSPFDVDGTLILPYDQALALNEQVGEVVDVRDPVTGNLIRMVAHEPMVRLLKEEKHRGAYIVVWSKGGWEWASSVIEALGLTGEIDQVMSKPNNYFDDVPIADWLPNRVFLDPKMPYKK